MLSSATTLLEVFIIFPFYRAAVGFCSLLTATTNATSKPAVQILYLVLMLRHQGEETAVSVIIQNGLKAADSCLVLKQWAFSSYAMLEQYFLRSKRCQIQNQCHSKSES